MVRATGVATAKFARKSARGATGAGRQGQDAQQQDGARLQGMGVQERRRPRRSYLMAGVVVVLGAYTLKMFSGSMQPIRVRVAKSGLAFKDWCRSNVGVAKEDFVDVVAEAKQHREKVKEGEVVHFNRELELNEKLDVYIEKLEKELEEKKEAPAAPKKPAPKHEKAPEAAPLDYNSMKWTDLQKLAGKRGLEVIGVKKDKVIADLKAMDKGEVVVPAEEKKKPTVSKRNTKRGKSAR